MPDNVIQVHDLNKVYGRSEDIAVHALRDVSLNIGRGEFVAVMGPSGSGKSTLMNILGALDRPTSGSYILDGQDISRLTKAELAVVRNQKVGFVFQSFNLLPRTQAIKQVVLPMLYSRRGKAGAEERQTRARKALEDVGLGDRLHHRPNEMSGGQQQRVAIARALINNPPLILADEPTGNLDSHSGQEIMAILRRLHGQGATIVMVTHDPEIAGHASRIICMHDGSVAADGNGSARDCLERGTGGKE
jgi:putative ABC transport system ATP-binding protein